MLIEGLLIEKYLFWDGEMCMEKYFEIYPTILQNSFLFSPTFNALADPSATFSFQALDLDYLQVKHGLH